MCLSNQISLLSTTGLALPDSILVFFIYQMLLLCQIYRKNCWDYYPREL
ncbi:unnamed protein product [Brassica oleracea]